MTAHELAARLLAGPNLPVTRPGYEGGVHEITVVMDPRPIHDAPGRSYFGPLEYHEPDGLCMLGFGCDLDAPPPTALAIHLE